MVQLPLSWRVWVSTTRSVDWMSESCLSVRDKPAIGHFMLVCDFSVIRRRTRVVMIGASSEAEPPRHD